MNFAAPIELADSSTGPNSTVMGVELAGFLCPSDVAEPTRGRTNFAASAGFGMNTGTSAGMFTDGSLSLPFAYIGPAEIRDGMSQTVAMSEWALGRYPIRDPLASVYRVTPAMVAPEEFDAFAAACQGLPPTAPIALIGKSANWFQGQIGETIFDQDVILNGHSCTNGDSGNYGAWTAGSRHPGGVNALFADAHVRFVHATVALSVWRALGTRSGGEIVSESSY